jgi:pyruvate/2-oxoglutarate/acetoin dehydrogenase E1 component
LAQSLEAWLASIPGLIVAVPSGPNEAKGLLRTAVRSNNPVLFFEPKVLYPVAGPVPQDDYFIPFGIADVKRSGNDCTVVAVGVALHEAMQAAETLAEQGISVEIIDPRTLVPFDWATVFGSAARTGRLVIVEEAALTLGWGAEVAAQAAAHLFHHLRAPVERVTALNVPLPYSPVLAKAALAGEAQIVAAVKRTMGTEGH